MVTTRDVLEIEIFSALLDAIDRGEYPAGGRLVETEIALRYGVSRTPVRLALKPQETNGGAERDARNTLIVAALDYDQLGELYDLMEVLEGTAARLAARRASPAEIDVLYEIVDRDADLIQNNVDESLIIDSDKRFHRQLHKASHNRYLLGMLNQMHPALAPLARVSLTAPKRSPQSVCEHSDLLDQIKARDEDAAEHAARKHIRNSYIRRLRTRSHAFIENAQSLADELVRRSAHR